MTKLLLCGAAVFLAIGPVAAQSAPPPGVAQGTTPVPQVAPRPRPTMQIHRMSMKTETRDEMVAHVREMFARLDSNRDGFVTRPEADAAHAAMMGQIRDRAGKRREGGVARLDRGARFDRIDTNHDGMISRQEFAANGHVPGTSEGPTRVTILRDEHAPGGAFHHREMGMAMHGRMFETADANRDGKVSLQEMTNMALRHFDQADANHDGRLAPEERMRMHPRIMMERVRVQPS